MAYVTLGSIILYITAPPARFKSVFLTKPIFIIPVIEFVVDPPVLAHERNSSLVNSSVLLSEDRYFMYQK